MMNENTHSKRKYAVVKFKSDSSYSEIPALWLMDKGDNRQWCLWPPRTANCATLMSNYTSPNYESWREYEVEIIKYCCKY